MIEQRSTHQAINTHLVTQPLEAAPCPKAQEDTPLARVLAYAETLIITAQFLYHINVTYHPLSDGTYQVDPVGDNSFTTIASAAKLGQAILDQITCFMESPAFIDAQVRRLAAI